MTDHTLSLDLQVPLYTRETEADKPIFLYRVILSEDVAIDKCTSIETDLLIRTCSDRQIATTGLLRVS